MTDSNTQAYKEIQLEIDKDQAQIFTRLLDESNPIPDLSGYYEVLFDAAAGISERTRLMLYFPPEVVLASASIEILLVSMSLHDYTIKETSVARKDYLEAYKKYYKSFRISDRFVIVPSWEKLQANKRTVSDIPLYLDPGLAFGTGKHPTTALCLQWLDQNLKPGAQLIDAGCGSGILSLGALLLGAASVFAFDVDGNAITAVMQNATMNADRIPGQLQCLQGGFDLLEFADTPADIMLGNLTANILIQNVESIAAGKFPALLLSGILVEQVEAVERTFAPLWQIQSQNSQEGWVLLYMTRK